VPSPVRIEFFNQDNFPAGHWVAAESLYAALRYARQRHHDFTVTRARLFGMIPLLSAPIDWLVTFEQRLNSEFPRPRR
jgi:hypothetical protein